MEVGKLYASAGLNFDQSGFDKFELAINQSKTQLLALITELDNVGKAASRSVAGVNGLGIALNVFKKASKPIYAISRALSSLENVLKTKNIDFTKLATAINDLSNKVYQSNGKVHKATNAWLRYKDAIDKVKLSVDQLRASFGNMPVLSPPAIGGHGGGHGGSGVGGHSSVASRLATPFVGSHLAHLFGGTGVATALGAAYALKEVAQTGQEYLTAQNFVRMGSDNEQDYNKNKDRVWNMAQKYGVDINQANESFGKMFPTLSGKIGKENSWKVMENQMQYFTAMHTNLPRQKLISKALVDMVGTPQVLASDFNQWNNNVAGGAKISERAAKILGIDLKGKSLKVALKDLKIRGDQLVPALVQAMQEEAVKNGALEVGMNSYQANATRFKNSLGKASAHFMEHGGGDFFSDIFKGAEKLIPVLEKLGDLFISIWKNVLKPFAQGVYGIYQGFKELADLFPVLKKNVTIVSGAILLLGLRLLFVAYTATPATAGALGRLTLVVETLNKTIRKNALMIVFVIATLVFEALQKMYKGQANWLENLELTLGFTFRELYKWFLKYEGVLLDLTNEFLDSVINLLTGIVNVEQSFISMFNSIRSLSFKEIMAKWGQEAEEGFKGIKQEVIDFVTKDDVAEKLKEVRQRQQREREMQFDADTYSMYNPLNIRQGDKGYMLTYGGDFPTAALDYSKNNPMINIYIDGSKVSPDRVSKTTISTRSN